MLSSRSATSSVCHCGYNKIYIAIEANISNHCYTILHNSDSYTLKPSDVQYCRCHLSDISMSISKKLSITSGFLTQLNRKLKIQKDFKLL